VTYYDADQKFFYVKRFQAEVNDKPQLFIDEAPGSYMVGITGTKHPSLIVTYGGDQANRPAETIDVEEFIGVKSHRAKGKRISTYTIDKLEFIKPASEELPEEGEDPVDDDPSDDGNGPDITGGENADADHGEDGNPLFEDDSDVQMALF